VRCLVVDDHPGIRAGVRRIVRRFGFTVDEAADGHAALGRLLVPPRYDVVLLDLQLPGIDGLSVLATIRRDPRLADLKVIVMTVDARLTTMVAAAHQGGDRYVLKPVDPTLLRRHLEQLLGPLPCDAP
jgi:CheY-like chemotaxis protein